MRKILRATLICSSLSLGAVGNIHASDQQNQLVLSISRPADELVALTCTGAPAGAFILQTATDIQAPAWSNVTTAVADAHGLFTWMMSCPRTESRRFFRLAQTSAGLMARNEIRFNGGAYLDSYDSSDPNCSTGGLYDPAKRRDHALAQTASRALGAINVGSGHVFGAVATGSGGSIFCGNGAVGDLAWNASNSGIQPGHLNVGMALSFQDITVPFTSGASMPGAGNVAGQSYSYVLGSGNYELPSMKLTGKESLAVTGNAVVYVAGDFMLSGHSVVYIAPGATLELYVGGTVSISGRGIINGSERAASCHIYGLPSCTAMTFSGTSTFYGVVDAPEAVVTLSGTADGCGSFMADTIVLSGAVGVHYDESLAGSAPR